MTRIGSRPLEKTDHGDGTANPSDKPADPERRAVDAPDPTEGRPSGAQRLVEQHASRAAPALMPTTLLTNDTEARIVAHPALRTLSFEDRRELLDMVKTLRPRVGATL